MRNTISNEKQYSIWRWPEDKDAIKLTNQCPLAVQLVLDELVDLGKARVLARVKVHATLTAILSAHFGCAEDCISLERTAGSALRCSVKLGDGEDRVLTVSISYAAGLAVLVIAFDQTIGVDLLKLDAEFLSQSWHAIAQLYLPPRQVEAILRLPSAAGAQKFAQEWVKLEARFKCAGMALAEYSASLHQRLPTCTYQWLRLPSPYLGVLALVP